MNHGIPAEEAGSCCRVDPWPKGMENGGDVKVYSALYRTYFSHICRRNLHQRYSRGKSLSFMAASTVRTLSTFVSRTRRVHLNLWQLEARRILIRLEDHLERERRGKWIRKEQEMSQQKADIKRAVGKMAKCFRIRAGDLEDKLAREEERSGPDLCPPKAVTGPSESLGPRLTESSDDLEQVLNDQSGKPGKPTIGLSGYPGQASVSPSGNPGEIATVSSVRLMSISQPGLSEQPLQQEEYETDIGRTQNHSVNNGSWRSRRFISVR